MVFYFLYSEAQLKSEILSDYSYLMKQDDFLPRTDIPLEDIFKSLFW